MRREPSGSCDAAAAIDSNSSTYTCSSSLCTDSVCFVAPQYAAGFLENEVDGELLLCTDGPQNSADHA